MLKLKEECIGSTFQVVCENPKILIVANKNDKNNFS